MNEKSSLDDRIIDVSVSGRDVAIQVRANNSTIREPCPICAMSHKDADVPYWLFTAETWEALCESCARKYVPQLYSEVCEGNRSFWAKE